MSILVPTKGNIVLAPETDLVRDYRAAGSTGIRCNDDAAIVETANNGCTSRGGLGERHAACMQGEVSVVVGEVEAWHDGGES